MIIDPYNFQTVKILDKQIIADDTVLITTARPANYDFLAGQYAIVKSFMPDGTSRIRQYSFLSSPREARLEFLIRRQPGGEVSNWFYDHAKPDDDIQVSVPLGKFLRPENQPCLMIAGGSGIAPFISMIRDSRDKTALLYSERTESRLCFHHELIDHLTNNYHPIITSQAGRISSSTLTKLINQRQVYICGSKVFVDSIHQLLLSIGVEEESIKRELFTLQ